MKSKILLFGGTFDPVHYGHIKVAQSALDQIGASGLVFIPAKRSPLKQFAPVAGNEARLAMLEFAISENDKFSISDCELKRAEPSYTLDTVKFFREKYGEDTELYWLIGADMAADLVNWYRIDSLLHECNLCVMTRPGYENYDLSSLECILDSVSFRRFGGHMISVPAVDVSSSQIRLNLAQNRDISEMVPRKVLDYIRKNRLYGS